MGVNMRLIAAIFLYFGFLAPGFAQDNLVAIDLLIEPDATMEAAAQDWNTRLREQMPEGYSLDASHRPHVSVLQTYVAAEDVDKVLAAVSAIVPSFNIGALQMEATG